MKNGKLLNFLIFGIYPIALVLNIIIVSFIARDTDISEILDLDFIRIFPPNQNYISTLLSFGFPKNEVAFVALTMTNAAALSYLFTFLYFILSGFVVPFLVHNGFIRVPETQTKAILATVCSAIIIYFALIFMNFEDTNSRSRLSIHAPLVLSLIKLNFILFCATYCIGFGAGSICEKLIGFVLKWGGR